MKTQWKNNVRLAALTIALLAFVLPAEAKKEKQAAQQDTTSYEMYSGIVINEETNKPVVFASVFKVGTSLGTVTNAEGEFVIKIPKDQLSGELGVSYIGYKNYTIDIASISKDDFKVKLTPSPVPIKEVVVRTDDPIRLLQMAKAKIPENYSTEPAMYTSFYRETIKQNRSYVAIAEAVLDIYKAPYKPGFDYDRVKIYKGRKSADVKKMDTILFKIQGGPKTSILLDVVKNPSALLDDEFMEYYDYNFGGVIEVDERRAYVIEFDQRPGVEYPLYAGKIYLDADNLAIAGVEFKLSEHGIDRAAQEFVRKKPTNMKINVEDARYLVKYRKLNGKWQLNHVRTELAFNCKWDRKLFKSKYTTMLEMAVTNSDNENVEKFKGKESAKMSDVFSDQVNYFMDENFWGQHNTIKPDESIESAIARINKKLK